MGRDASATKRGVLAGAVFLSIGFVWYITTCGRQVPVPPVVPQRSAFSPTPPTTPVTVPVPVKVAPTPQPTPQPTPTPPVSLSLTADPKWVTVYQEPPRTPETEQPTAKPKCCTAAHLIKTLCNDCRTFDPLEGTDLLNELASRVVQLNSTDGKFFKPGFFENLLPQESGRSLLPASAHSSRPLRPQYMGFPLPRRRCRSSDELNTGTYTLANNTHFDWLPSDCDVKVFSPEDIQTCLNGVKIVALGDSQCKNVMVQALSRHTTHFTHIEDERTSQRLHPTCYAHDLIRPKGMPMTQRPLDKGLEFIWHMNHSWAESATPVLNAPYVRKTISQADVVVMNAGAWDSGMEYCSMAAFYFGVKAEIKSLLQVMKKDAKLLFRSIPFMHLDHCYDMNAVWAKKKNPHERIGHARTCVNCNLPPKTRALREAVTLAAAAHGLGINNFGPLVHQINQLSYDGMHMAWSYNMYEFNAVLNQACLKPAMLTQPPIEWSEEIEREALLRWDNVPETRQGCPGAGTKQCHNKNGHNKVPVDPEVYKKNLAADEALRKQVHSCTEENASEFCVSWRNPVHLGRS